MSELLAQQLREREHRSWVTVVPDAQDASVSRLMLHCTCGSWVELLGADLPLDILNALTDQHLARELRAHGPAGLGPAGTQLEGL